MTNAKLQFDFFYREVALGRSQFCRFKVASVRALRLAAIGLLLAASGCSEFGGDSAPKPDAVAQTSAPVMQAALPETASSPPTALPANPSEPLDRASDAAQLHPIQLFQGTDSFVKHRRPSSRGATAGDTSLDFADADIRDVVRSVMGDLLHLPYVVDPRVSGRVTLKTGAPIAKSDILPAFETALKIGGAAIVMSNGMYDIVPLSDAQKQAVLISSGARQGEPGYGVEIVPLQYVAADEMQKVLGPLVPPGSIVNVDETRNLIFIAGTEPDRSSIREMIALFDVDYLKSMSFAIIQPVHVDAETLATELDKVFEGTGSPISGLVRLIPVSRINSLLIVTSRAAYLSEVSKWINRLDVPPVEPGRRLYYYRLQNARAADIAQTLSQLFGGAATAPPAMAAPPSAAMALPASAPPNFETRASPPSPSLAASANPPDFRQMQGPASAASGNANGPLIVTDIPNNALIIRADQADYEAIERIIKAMDVSPDQVLIEATIAEVTLNDTLKYGVEWYFKNSQQTYTLSQTGTVSQSFPGFAFSYVVPNVQVAVSALGSVSHVSVLSSPRILTLDNKAASLEVGDQVPIVSQTAVSVTAANAPLVSTVQMQNTGVILTVTPRIGKSGMVFLDVSQEVSDAIPTTTSEIDSPTIEDRKLQATVAIHDGQTVALGGLIQQTKTRSNGGIPFLKDIPILGNLGRNLDDETQRTELLVFLTPRVIHNSEQAQQMTDELTRGLADVKDAMDGMKK
jgi:general secretion pathway protein D